MLYFGLSNATPAVSLSAPGHRLAPPPHEASQRHPATRTPILVVGTPRSGTTWAGQVLAQAGDTCSVHEPDNEMHDPWALRAKRTLGRFPVLTPWDLVPPEYELLWERALSGYGHRHTARWLAAKAILKHAPRAQMRLAFDQAERRFSPRLRVASRLASVPSREPLAPRPIVKSVHGALALGWITWRFRPEVVILTRHPLNTVASYLELGWLDAGLHDDAVVRARYLAPWVPALPSRASDLARVAWQIGLLSSTLLAAAQANPEWHLVSHEELCADPINKFERLFKRLEMPFGDEACKFLEASNRPGTGLVTNRVASEQPERWRKRLSPAQVAEIRAVLADFPVPDWITAQAS